MLTVTSARAGQGGGGGYVANAVSFDGTNDYMLRGAELTGIADSKTGILSAWVRIDGGIGGTMQLFTNDQQQIRILTTGAFQVLLYDVNPLVILNISSSTFIAGATWRHLLASWDLAATASDLYMNDVSDQTVTTRTDAAVDWDSATNNWGVGANLNGTNKINASLAEVYFAPGQYLDFSVEANRRLFISAAGKPVSLGADGSLPTGTAPIVYLANPAASFQTNLGSGGDFTVTGTLTAASTSPSD